MKDISKHDIDNAFLRPGVALSDPDNGIYRLLPPELLCTTQEGITKYIILTFSDLIGVKRLKQKLIQFTEHSTVINQETAKETFKFRPNALAS